MLEFLDACPGTIDAQFTAVLDAVARPLHVQAARPGRSRGADPKAHRTRFTGKMANAPMMAQSPATMYSTP